ncbi:MULTISPECIES: TIGR03749 family integrating conjugative element protein [unclassified Pseudomonas]|uniref:TIGR03749 family integrating conjugative element protein n=1 Tax=unclassified Pseudomonas TaxID=196821 RepID=UPI000C86B538|nr:MULTISPECIES: TIGR03749 family integrating conjugative element protein [unclassified Pseudomonas]PMV25246.1 TIGR03749 family integrating conjugative element protein [Pseudomonas sp. FW305-3-2-15-C-TSA2]PMV28968.1 TIGR03749 family integrating conjugative element protein [Pseudomonas sp. DP16D-L5]PMV38963.1 TIGR03749 family integrating conjugative element protein [Pseudomonas sp. FW305-3-2-15-A-LB2]PMV40998.1 TIGR03749 family integrating conjugative element protein [Pseudomonas sp. FW305-3-2-1
MKRYLLSAVLLLPIPLASAVEILRWERLPLAVPLQVGQERVVFIDRNVRVGLPASLQGKLRVQSAGGALYLLASESIAPSRLQLQDADDGTLILLDIAAEPAKAGQPALETVKIVEAERPAPRDTVEAPAPRPAPPTPLPVALTRYAAQSLYTPLRSVEAVPGLGAVPLRSDLNLDSLLPELTLSYRALAAWRLEDLWVTAIRLRNRSLRWIELDPRRLQGDFVSATFQHPDLGPKGDATDTTVLYLVTRGRGLAGALLPAISPVDAALNLPRSSSDEE